MGILDDAIRQHLELKRQHGAPEEELQRQEEEALGPARRDVAPAEPAGGDGDVELEAEGGEAVSEEETELFEPAPDELETMLEESEPSDEPELETMLEEPSDEPELESVPEPESVPPSPAPFDADTAFDGLAEQDEPDEEEPEDEAEAASEEPDPARDEADVLEDTPDFLQETPEHDRLWFEQKPPRDFDFD
jgi:hypothetical protein